MIILGFKINFFRYSLLLKKHLSKGGYSNADPLSERFISICLKNKTVFPAEIETL